MLEFPSIIFQNYFNKRLFLFKLTSHVWLHGCAHFIGRVTTLPNIETMLVRNTLFLIYTTLNNCAFNEYAVVCDTLATNRPFVFLCDEHKGV